MKYEPLQSIYEVLGPQGLAVVDVSPMFEDGYEGWYVNRVLVPEAYRNAGVGTRMMKALCEKADALGETLYLHPVTNYGSDINRLERFYKRFGFKWQSNQMIWKRIPKQRGGEL